MPKSIIYLFFILFSCQVLSAQERTSNKDSVKVYKNIENYSNKSKFGKVIYKLLFKSNEKSKPSKAVLKQELLNRKSFSKHEDKIIRNIRIETLDPFGYTIESENDKPEKGFENFGNHFHIKSKNWTIRNLLLFKKNQPLDSLITKESERLIRSQRYVRSVIIKPVAILNSKDSVDISIRVLDSWSLIPTGAISGSQGNFEIKERNFMGLGHELENNFSKRFVDKNNGYFAKYTINNIKNTFLNASASYNNDLDNNLTKNIKIERPFFSTYTRLAGGIAFEDRYYRDSLPDFNNDFEIQNFKNRTPSFWIGHSFKIFKGNDENNMSTNLVTTIGLKKVSYYEAPTIDYDPNRFYASENLYLTSIGLTTRKFVQDKYLFNFGIIEDIPYGKVYSITGGFQEKNNINRAYFATRFSYGNYFDFGYLGTNIEWGSFFNKGKNEETTFKIEVNYFTNLMYLGNWKIRNFVNSSLVLGSHRAPIIKDRLNINESNGINGFNSPLLLGTKKLVLNFQTQTYAPGNWHGFHFSPFFNFTLGLLGDQTNLFFDDRLYSKIGCGVLINNDYLVFNSFQLSLAFYPSIPFEGSAIFKTNSFKNNDLVVPDYLIGQPNIVPYQ